MNSDPSNLREVADDHYFGAVYFDNTIVDTIPKGMSKNKELLIDGLKREIKNYCGSSGTDPNDERWEIRIK